MSESGRQDWIVEVLHEIQRDVAKINVTLGEQHVSLIDHIRRTAILEKRVDGMWLRVMSVLGGLVGIAVGLLELFKVVSH